MTGLLPRAALRFVPERRAESLCRDLVEEAARDSHLRVSEVCYACGFKQPAHFSRALKAHFGLCPRSFRGSVANDGREA